MAYNKRPKDLNEYRSILPFDSEIFGIYQPLIGWKSKRIEKRLNEGLFKDKTALYDRLKKLFKSNVVVGREGCTLYVHIEPGTIQKAAASNRFSLVIDEVIKYIWSTQEIYDPSVWLTEEMTDKISQILQELAEEVERYYTEQCTKLAQDNEKDKRELQQSCKDVLERESIIAGVLLYYISKKNTDILTGFYKTRNEENLDQEIRVASDTIIDAYIDLSNLDPTEKEQLSRVSLSPISVVNLFRQYFFELDTFLGSPVSHVWLSPGASVELIEIHTRKTITERSMESSIDSFVKMDKQITEQDEISDAIKEDNRQDTKLGASASASYGIVSATSSFDYTNSQQVAREESHKRTRQQTELLSTAIRKNFKSTFKTTTEITDSSSKRYVLANTTDKLVNYELRRKMRQVGVQVQDIGTYLCWQTYVDDPGRDLGIAKLVHIAQPADLANIPHPEEIPLLEQFKEERMVTIPFISTRNDADNKDEIYVDGVEQDNSEPFGKLEMIRADFDQEFVCPRSNYYLSNVEFDSQGKPIKASRRGDITNSETKANIRLHLDSADFQGQNSVLIKVILHWSPSEDLNEAIKAKNEAALDKFKAKEAEEFKKTFIENAKNRITLASKINERNEQDLREEERIVVYRRLIQDMLSNGITMVSDQTRHVVSELINSIFDVEKMLYFVAPEWWRPRLHRSHQQIGDVQRRESETSGSERLEANRFSLTLKKIPGSPGKGAASASLSAGNVLNSSSTGWGEVDSTIRDNYFITEDSDLAKFGSSLGWLLQLDGDNMRNAFLNAPWVKAVIPIRPGKEEAAINWLKSIEGFNGMKDATYKVPDGEKDIDGLDGKSMEEALKILAKRIKEKHEEGKKPAKFPVEKDVDENEGLKNDDIITSTPVDRVFEHGFYPLRNNFKIDGTKNFQIFDQWIEILPTDQIVPVEVEYDSKTGRMK
jgi:hypothetical protein